jgi:hypothetical protein
MDGVDLVDRVDVVDRELTLGEAMDYLVYSVHLTVAVSRVPEMNGRLQSLFHIN